MSSNISLGRPDRIGDEFTESPKVQALNEAQNGPVISKLSRDILKEQASILTVKAFTTKESPSVAMDENPCMDHQVKKVPKQVLNKSIDECADDCSISFSDFIKSFFSNNQ